MKELTKNQNGVRGLGELAQAHFTASLTEEQIEAVYNYSKEHPIDWGMIQTKPLTEEQIKAVYDYEKEKEYPVNWGALCVQ